MEQPDKIWSSLLFEDISARSQVTRTFPVFVRVAAWFNMKYYYDDLKRRKEMSAMKIKYLPEKKKEKKMTFKSMSLSPSKQPKAYFREWFAFC